LSSPEIQHDINYRHQHGGTRQALTFSQIAEFEIPVLQLSEQRRIADILDEADTLRRQRAEAIRLANDLVPSVFYELFGDPQTNPQRWPVEEIRRYMTDSQYGTAEKSNEEGRGLPVLRMNNIRYDGRLDLDDLKWCEIADDDIPIFTVRKGDLLFNRTNSRELVGKTGVWNRDEQYAFAGYLVRFRFDPSHLLPEYVSAVMNSQYGKRMLYNRAKPSVNMSNINATEFASLPVVIPPIELQRRFALFVAESEAFLNPLQQSRSELNNLFNSLLQRAFRGEL
jgi:type I restriction enzyme S subunit